MTLLARTGLPLILLCACREPEPQPEPQPQPAAPPRLQPASPPPAPVVVDAATLAIPHLGIELDGCAVDLDVPLVELAAPLVSLVVTAKPSEQGAYVERSDCAGVVLVELPRELLAAEAPRSDRGDARIRIRADPSRLTCETPYLIGACLRDRSGALHPSLRDDGEPYGSWAVMAHADGAWLNAPRLLTPSGATDDTLGVARGWQLVGADPTTGARVLVEVRAVRHGLGPAVTLRMATGEALHLPNTREVWHSERASWTRASEVVAGDRLFGLTGPLEVRAVEARAVDRTWLDVSDVSAPDTYFIGDVLVRDARPTPGEPRPLTPEHDPFDQGIADLAAELHSYDCSLRTTLTLRGWPERADTLALRVMRHPGPPGARVAFACDRGEEIASVSRGLWDAWRAHRGADDSAALTLSLEAGAPGWEAEEPGFTGAIGCSSEVALQVCARGRDGASTALMPSARWGLSGAPCFATGTPIETPTGPVAIEALGPGSLVRSLDVASGEAREARVLRRVSRGIRPVLRLRLADGGELRVTGEHPLWLPRARRFRPAGALRPGDVLQGERGEELRVEDLARAGATEVWELSVAAPDTYFAGGVLAHNY